MKIQLDERELSVPPEIEKSLVDQLYSLLAEGLYAQVPTPVRLAMKLVSRNKLAELEQQLNEAGYEGKRIRPPDGSDPNLHYARIMLASSLGDLKDAKLCIETEPGTDTVKSVTLPGKNPGEVGRQVSAGRNEREREDMGDAGAGSAFREAVPNA